MSTIRAAAAAILGSGLILGGCASGLGANDYPRAAVGQVNRVEEASVVAVRQVMLEGTKTVLGPAAGAAVGGVAGGQVGGGNDERAIGAVVGAVVGGLAGAAIEEGATRQRGFAYTVRLAKSGELVTITQAADIAIPVGAAVFVEYGARPRVIPR